MRLIFNGHEKHGGVYRLTNVQNGRVYIGGTQCFSARWREHVADLSDGKHANKRLQADFDRFGSDAFVFEIVHVVVDAEERAAIERSMIDEVFGESCYNSTRATRAFVPSLETREKLSRAAKGRSLSTVHAARISRALTGRTVSEGTKAKLRGRVFSDESKARMRAAKVGKKNGPMSAETKAKIGAANKGRRRSPEHVEKSAAARRGKPLSEGHKAKLRAHKHTEESKLKISKALKGRVFTEQHKARLRDAQKRRAQANQTSTQDGINHTLN